jgi:methylated-DNA-[protein]-cysteine S-methyltransferase
MTLFDTTDTPASPGPATPARIAAEVRPRSRESSTVARATAEAARLELAQDLIDSPVGPMLAIAGEDGLHSLWFLDADHGLSPRPSPSHAGHRWIEQARRELDEYFAGRRVRFEVPLKPHGTPFQASVWRELLKIDCGSTLSYGAIARALDKPNAFRAVGLAVGRNPISILVPCHRVIGENGTLTGYAGGLPRKRFLLGLELKADSLPLSVGAAASDRLRR